MKIKNVTIMLLLLAIIVTLNGNVVMADETSNQCPEMEVLSVEDLDNGITRTTYETTVTEEDINEDGDVILAASTNSVDSSFTMTGKSHRGADRKYDGNYLSYTARITDTKGKAVNKAVTIKLWDYNENCLKSSTINADSAYHTVSNIKIVSGRTYYFKYHLAKGTTSNLKIRMIIETWK